jgi:ribonuclease HI
VSDISTAAGNFILEAWFHPHTKKPSRSTLHWPRQKEPCKAAWLSWKKFLKSFLHPNGQLKKTLGPWTRKNPSRIHEAYATEQGEMLWLNERNRNQFHGHPNILNQRKSINFTSTPTTMAMELPPYAIPVDVLFQGPRTIKTSNVPNQLPTAKKEIPAVWYKKAPNHLRHLIGDVLMNTTEETISQAITPNSKFEIATGGGYEPTTGISTYGWVVAANTIIIAKGKGPAQAHPSMAESFRAEGYGLTSACLFIKNLSQRFNIKMEQHHWVIYIDSKSLIQRMDSFRTRTNIPRWNLRPDEDICKVAYELLRQLPIQIQHIKSHQDQKQLINELPFGAVLNMMADKEATRQQNLITNPDTNVHILGAAQLRINDIAITCDSHRWLMHTAGKIPIQQYYKEHLGWSTSTFKQISWDTQLAVL